MNYSHTDSKNNYSINSNLNILFEFNNFKTMSLLNICEIVKVTILYTSPLCKNKL